MRRVFEIPGHVASAANLREHWAAKAKRVQGQRRKAMLKCPKWTGGPLLVVTLTRVAPRELDGDNWQAAAKGTRDGIAARLRIDDSSPLVAWEYRQATCKPGEECVRVSIARAP